MSASSQDFSLAQALYIKVMKRAFQHVLFFLMLGSTALGQFLTKTETKEDGTYTWRFREDGSKSSLLYWKKGNATGWAKAWDAKGKEIYHQKISRSGLISMVEFRYYEKGDVKEARYTWHPDGGIQSGGELVYFEPDGQVARRQKIEDPRNPDFFKDQQSPGPGVTPQLHAKPLKKPSPPQKKLMHHSEIWLKNTSKKELIVRCIRFSVLSRESIYMGLKIAPDDSVRVDRISAMGSFAKPGKEQKDYLLGPGKRVLKKYEVEADAFHVEEADSLTRRYYFRILKK